MTFIHHIPKHYLNKYIDSIIYYKGYKPKHSIERIVPDCTINLIFELDNMPRQVYDNETLKPTGDKRTKAWLSGMHSNYITINALQDSEMFVIRFKPFASYAFIHKPIYKYNNKVVMANIMFGEEIFKFREELLAIEKPENKIKAGEYWLSQRFDKSKLPDAVVEKAYNEILSNPIFEQPLVKKLIEESGFSKKHFLNLFKKFIGLTPKKLQRILRFKEILTSIQNDKKLNWARISSECGYFDQAHFIKEFKMFCGINPKEFFEGHNESGRVNFFPLN